MNDLREIDDENVCEIFYTNLRKQKALEMKPNELFITLAEEIKDKHLYDANSKYIAILSFTQYSNENSGGSGDIFKNTKGYCALGEF